MAAPWTWKHVWPIEDPSWLRAECIAAAQPELDRALAEHRIVPTGEPAWRVVEHDRAGWPDTELVLVATVPAVPGVPTPEQWPALVAWAAGQGWTDRTLAGLLGVPVELVRGQRRRAGIPGHAARGRAA